MDLERVAFRHGLGGCGAEAALLAVDHLSARILRDLAQLAGGVVGLQNGLIARVLAHRELLDVHGRLFAALSHAACLVGNHVEHERVVAGGGLAADVLAALGVEIAGKGHHDGEGLGDARRVDRELDLLAAREAGMRAGVDIPLDGGFDLLFVELAELRRTRRGPRGHVLDQDIPRSAIGLAAYFMASRKRRLGIGHHVALFVEPLENLLGAQSVLVLPITIPENELVMRLVPCGIQLLVSVFGQHGLPQLISRAVAVGVFLVDEKRRVGPVAREVGGAFAGVDDFVDEREHERHIGAGTNGQPQIGLRSGAGEAGADADHLRAALLGAPDREPVVIAARAFLAAPDQNAVGVVAVPAGVLRLIAVEALAREIRAHPAQVAHAERGGRTQFEPQLVDRLELQHVASRAVLVGDGMPAVRLAYLGEFVARGFVGFFPRNALPSARPLLADALLRIADARGIVQLLRDAERAGAKRSFAEQVGVALNLGQAAVFHRAEQSATAIALAACARNDLDVFGGIR